MGSWYDLPLTTTEDMVEFLGEEWRLSDRPNEVPNCDELPSPEIPLIDSPMT